MLRSLRLALISTTLAAPAPGDEPPESLAPAVEEGPFLRPAEGAAAEPVWGVKGGIAVGLWPTSGPRGLIRIYAPYLDQPHPRMINFVAVEPIVGPGRARGLSELEPSRLDGVPGKRMWSADRVEEAAEPRPPWSPARGRVEGPEGARTLSFAVFVEPFDNGARPVVEVTLREDRPREVAFRTFAAEGGEPMRVCILTATMGNYGRLRRLHLADAVVEAPALYREAMLDDWGFYPHRDWGLDRLRVEGGEASVSATSDEADPASAEYAEGTFPGWFYRGRPSVQAWRAPAAEALRARVNARRTYWASRSPIPGGISFENFELEAPFEPGGRFTFAVEPAGGR